MARTTRATKSSNKSAAEATAAAATNNSRFTLPEQSATPPKLFILPNQATSEARVVTLSNPRHGKPSRYLACPETGIYEFTQITAPKATPRSWLVESASGDVARQADGESSDESFGAQAIQGADLFIATPVDPIFLVLSGLTAQGQGKRSDPPKRMFLSSDDHFDSISSPGDLSDILRLGRTREQLESRMAAICDTVDAPDEKMFRLNETKLLEEIVGKSKRMSENGLPKSMEEKFVTKPLEAPIVGIRSQAAPAAPEGEEPAQADSQTSVSSTESASTATSDASSESTAATSASGEPASGDVVVSAITASPEVLQLQRLRVAFNFICASYIAPQTAALLKTEVETNKELVDFTPLNEYLEKLAKLRQEAAALRTADYSCKRSREEDEDERAEKRRKKEEDDKRKKANESRGVKELKKVNTSGMKKLSEFFKKK